MKTITRKFMLFHNFYHSKKEMERKVLKGRQSITLNEFLSENDIALDDKYWFVCYYMNTKEQNLKLSLLVAETFLYLYEDKYPEDKRLRIPLDAIKNYSNGSITIEELSVINKEVKSFYNFLNTDYTGREWGVAMKIAYYFDGLIDPYINPSENNNLDYCGVCQLCHSIKNDSIRKNLLQIIKDSFKNENREFKELPPHDINLLSL